MGWRRIINGNFTIYEHADFGLIVSALGLHMRHYLDGKADTA